MKISALALPLLAASVSAQLATFNAGNNIEYAFSVPQQTAQSGHGELFFQMKGPAAYQWIAMGFGERMAGAMIFVMYADGMGNLTVSPRQGKGEVEPEHWDYPQIELMPGTGVKNGMMTANVKCTNCESWQGGSIDFSNSQQTFIHAYRTGAPIDSTSKSAELEQHQHIGETFAFNLQQASGGSPTNPFSAQATMMAGGVAATSSGSTTVVDPELAKEGMVIKAHGIIMGLTVAVLFPVGALLMRVLSVKGLWAIHGAFQLFALCMLTAGFGTGYWFAGQTGLRYEGEGFTHTVFGTILFAFFWIQPFLGYAHHALYKKQGKRTAVSHVHMWFGRIVMLLGMINGGLGLQLAADTTGGEIAYGVVCGIVGLGYIVIVGFVEGRKLGSGNKASHHEKASSQGS